MKNDLYKVSARDCAIQMMENAAYIQKELPSLPMPDELRGQIEALCETWIAVKHDVIHELVELDGETREEAEQCTLLSVHRRLAEGVDPIDPCVQAVLGSKGNCHPALALLIMESARNVLVITPAHPDCSDVVDEAEEEDGELSGCFALLLEDRHFVSIIRRAVTTLQSRDEHEPDTSEGLRAFAFGLERLPQLTPGIQMSLRLRLSFDGESSWMEIRFEGDELSLSRGSWSTGDAQTETIFEVGEGHREGNSFIGAEFAEAFARCAEDVCREIEIENFGGEPFSQWDLKADDSLWLELSSEFC